MPNSQSFPINEDARLIPVWSMVAAGITTASGRGYHILWYLSQTGVTFIGPMEGRQQTIGLLAEAAPQPTELARPEAIAELARRYFTSHGPAAIQDFMWWSGLTATDAKAGLEANKASLTAETIEGREYWLPKAAITDGSPAASFLLPGFDEYLLGYKDRGAVLSADYAAKIIPGGNGVFFPTIILGGRVAGSWKRLIKRDHVLITLSPFRSFTPDEIASLQAPAEQYGRFVGLPPKVVYAPVS